MSSIKVNYSIIKSFQVNIFKIPEIFGTHSFDFFNPFMKVTGKIPISKNPKFEHPSPCSVRIMAILNLEST